jgi:hypothetical protein
VNDRLLFARNCVAAVAASFIVTVAPALAANTMYLDFESGGTIGEATPKTQDALKSTLIEISSFRFGAGHDVVTPSSTSGSAAAGQPAPKRTVESMDATISSLGAQKAFDLAASGKVIPYVMFYEFRLGVHGKVPVYTAKMSNVIVTSRDWKGTGDHPSSNITLDYQAIEIRENAKSDSDDVTTPATWNITANKPT